jgi:hypothetical protein
MRHVAGRLDCSFLKNQDDVTTKNSFDDKKTYMIHAIK